MKHDRIFHMLIGSMFFFLMTGFCLSGCRKKAPVPAADPEVFETLETETEWYRERPVWELLGEDVMQWAAGFSVSEVKDLKYTINGEESEDYLVTDEGTIQDFFDALNMILVTGQAEGYASETGDVFCFEMKDGTSVAVEFCLSALAVDRDLYEIYDADRLWELTGLLIGGQ